MRKVAFVILMALLLTVGGCNSKEKMYFGLVEKVDIPSALLGKSITSFVYLPYAYDDTKAYPSLYFMSSAGGSAYTVINQFDIASAADKLMQSGEIEPMIIVALGIDFSFGINSSNTVGSSTFESEQVYTFAEGLYEDYITQEAIPYIDAHYATYKEAKYRYIGGYSMGGFAALHVGFRNPTLFSKIGGHSPTLFLGTYITPEIDHWLFPTEQDRIVRDPMMLAETAELQGMQVFLDTGPTDVNVEACSVLMEKLKARGIDVTLSIFTGSHGFTYCKEHMSEYLDFYGAASSNDN